MSLREYKAKRNFQRTAEPPAQHKKSLVPLTFVIQKHDASRRHYDFRLELHGVLKSWAVPKGLPTKKGDRRLAMMVEDHPLDYERFEGIIPKGEYGGGTVMVWDIGTWKGLGSLQPAHDLAEGKLHFALHGKKLDGEWTLLALKNSDEKNAWLLLKSGESVRAITKKRDDESVLTQRTMQQIAAAQDAEWHSDRAGQKKAVAKKPVPPPHLPAARPAFVEPMKAKLVDRPPVGDEWMFELKFDGFRALAIKRGETLELLSRNRKNLGKKFVQLVPELKKLPCRDAVIDGEIVALDVKGRSSFQLLQAYELHQQRPPICFYAFDLLNLEGREMCSEPLATRKALLEKLLRDAPDAIRFSAALEGDVDALLAKIRELGLEGLIGKRCDSIYETGRRSGAWVKLKVTQQQEFVIGGYTAPQGTRKYFGALLVGFYGKGKLLFAAKVGTGFSVKTLRTLHERMLPLRRLDCPFANLPMSRHGRRGDGITRADMSRCTWVDPKLVGQVRFTEWTHAAGLRHPAFLGLREDKAAHDVRRESPT